MIVWVRTILEKVRIKKLIRGVKVGKNIYLGKYSSFEGKSNISIGDNFSSGFFSKLQVWENEKTEGYKLIIGNNVSAMSNFQVSCIKKVSIGDNCLFGDNVFITDNMHGGGELFERSIPPIDRKLYSKAPVVVGDNVWIGRNVCILPGAHIGNGVIVGANAVVTAGEYEDNVVLVGIPARKRH